MTARFSGCLHGTCLCAARAINAGFTELEVNAGIVDDMILLGSQGFKRIGPGLMARANVDPIEVVDLTQFMNIDTTYEQIATALGGDIIEHEPAAEPVRPDLTTSMNVGGKMPLIFDPKTGDFVRNEADPDYAIALYGLSTPSRGGHLYDRVA